MVARWQIEDPSCGSWDKVKSMSSLLSQEQLRQLLCCARLMRLFHVNTGANPGFLLRVGTPVRNDVMAGEACIQAPLCERR